MQGWTPLPTCPRDVPHDCRFTVTKNESVLNAVLVTTASLWQGTRANYLANDTAVLPMQLTVPAAEGSRSLTQAAVLVHAGEGEDVFPLSRLPPDLRAAVLQRLPLPDRVQASSICASWRSTVAGLSYPELTVTTAQLTQPSFLHWLCFPGRAEQVCTAQRSWSFAMGAFLLAVKRSAVSQNTDSG